MKRIVFGLLVLLPAFANAQGKRLAIVELSTPPNLLGLGAQLARTVDEAAKAQGFTVMTPEQVRTQLGEDRINQLHACGGAPGCIAAKLQGVAADRVVVGSLDRDEKSYLVKLWLIDLASSQLVADVDRAILIASRRLQTDVEEAVPGLLQGKKEARGTLNLTATTNGVDITVDGKPAGKTPLTLALKPGKHEVRAEKKAFYPITRYVTVTAEQTTNEELRLLKIPGEVAEDEALPELARPATLDAPEPGIPHEALALGAGSLVLASAGTGFVLAYNKTKQSQGEAYAASHQGRADQRHSAILFAGAGAFALAGVIAAFVMDGDGVQAGPSVAAGSAGVVIHSRF